MISKSSSDQTKQKKRNQNEQILLLQEKNAIALQAMEAILRANQENSEVQNPRPNMAAMKRSNGTFYGSFRKPRQEKETERLSPDSFKKDRKKGDENHLTGDKSPTEEFEKMIKVGGKEISIENSFFFFFFFTQQEIRLNKVRDIEMPFVEISIENSTKPVIPVEIIESLSKALSVNTTVKSISFRG
jgi:hypothetical protein